ncbi:hypothetical protein GCM10010381_16110 [Streptomyces xantholiticus]|nr:hypothetical protein GCM10010381_16110 [Streptomyces xantholiticus]
MFHVQGPALCACRRGWGPAAARSGSPPRPFPIPGKPRAPQAPSGGCSGLFPRTPYRALGGVLKLPYGPAAAVGAGASHAVRGRRSAQDGLTRSEISPAGD